ncbi:hypothetical protein CsSME_00029681 [Camellia sinensis var. sinensis]
MKESDTEAPENSSVKKALANALASAPSMLPLGNAGMGALQNLGIITIPSVSRSQISLLFRCISYIALTMTGKRKYKDSYLHHHMVSGDL